MIWGTNLEILEYTSQINIENLGLGVGNTVDGRNPAPPDIYETLSLMGYLPYQLVQDFFQQP